MLSTPWEQRKASYDFVIIGSGYGGAITAARLATANLTSKPSICILERGKEYKPGDYPQDLGGVLGATRGTLNPLGLYELLQLPGYFGNQRFGPRWHVRSSTPMWRSSRTAKSSSSSTGRRKSPTIRCSRSNQEAHRVLAANPHPDAMKLAKIQP
ncbi:MAG: hypothetical protein WDO73_17960 [Ignavibacteriota bacterium]